jgi:hypothetical protein
MQHGQKDPNPITGTVPLYKVNYLPINLVLSLVLTTVLSLPCRTDAKNDDKNYQEPTTSRENAIRKHLNFLWFSVIMT